MKKNVYLLAHLDCSSSATDDLVVDVLDVEVEASGGEGVVGRGGVALDQLGEDGLDEAEGHLGLGLDGGHAKHSDEGLRGLQKMSGNRFEEMVATILPA